MRAITLDPTRAAQHSHQPAVAAWTPAPVKPIARPPDPGVEDPAESSPPSSRMGTHREPAQIHRVRAGGRSRGVTQPVPYVYLPVSLTTPGPSGSPEPTRLCRGCSHPPRRPPDQAASSFTSPLRRQRDGRSLTSIRQQQRLVAHSEPTHPAHVRVERGGTGGRHGQLRSRRGWGRLPCPRGHTGTRTGGTAGVPRSASLTKGESATCLSAGYAGGPGDQFARCHGRRR